MKTETKAKPTHEVIVIESDGEIELIDEGSEREMIAALAEMIAEHDPESGEAYAGYPIPDYRMQPIDWTRE